MYGNENQSRMCGKEVGLGLFPSEVEKWPFFDHSSNRIPVPNIQEKFKLVKSLKN